LEAKPLAYESQPEEAHLGYERYKVQNLSPKS